MKTEYREHPLGTPGLSVRLGADEESRRPERPRGRVQRFLQWIARALVYRSNGPQ